MGYRLIAIASPPPPPPPLLLPSPPPPPPFSKAGRRMCGNFAGLTDSAPISLFPTPFKKNLPLGRENDLISLVSKKLFHNRYDKLFSQLILSFLEQRIFRITLLVLAPTVRHTSLFQNCKVEPETIKFNTTLRLIKRYILQWQYEFCRFNVDAWYDLLSSLVSSSA